MQLLFVHRWLFRFFIRCDGILGMLPPVSSSHTMLWWLFLSMMSAEGRSSFLIGDGGGLTVLTLALNRSDT